MLQNSSGNSTETSVLTLSRLSTQIRESLAVSFPETFWVIAEISELHVNSSGHAYLELIEKHSDNNQILARMRATVWSYTYRMLRPYFEATTGYQLASGIKVLLLVSLEFHAQYSISLNVKDIDPSYTLGDLARKKTEIINRLRKEGVMEMNQQIPLPIVPQRIAIVSSPTAAGFEDFLNSLSSNIHNFHFDITLFQAIMQGEKAGASIIEALETIYENESLYDVVVLIRGGGAQIDLECFNNYELAFHVAQFPLPVLTGIGHERDETVTDMVAHLKLKTPTAVAEFLVDRMTDFLLRLQSAEEIMQRFVNEKLQVESTTIHELATRLLLLTRKKLHSEDRNILDTGHRARAAVRSLLVNSDAVLRDKHTILKHISGNLLYYEIQKIIQLRLGLSRIISQNIRQENDKLSNLKKVNELYDPGQILSRGFSITLWKGKVLKDHTLAEKGDELVTVLHSGKLISKVE